MDYDNLWKKTDEAFKQQRSNWTDPPHIGISTIISSYTCPADDRTLSLAVDSDGMAFALTSYLGVLGTDSTTRDGILYLDSRTRMGDIVDGASNTLLVGERPPSADLQFGRWYSDFGSGRGGSTTVLLGANEVLSNMDIGVCSQVFTFFQPGKVNQQCDKYHFWGLHSGGANFLMADGSVHFLSYSVQPVLVDLATRAGGETPELVD